MRYLIDTDWVIDYLKGKNVAHQLLARLINDGIAISIITYGEIYEGIYYGGSRQAAESGFSQFLQSADVLSLTLPIMRRYGQLRGQLRKTGLKIGDADLLIAATALEHDLILVTRNLAHFDRIPNLELFENR